MAEKWQVLIVDDEDIALRSLQHVMAKAGYEATATKSGSRALALLETRSFDLVLTDLRMEKVDGMEVLKKCRELHPDAEVILITGYATAESAVQAMKEGAFYYLAKPFRLDEVRKVVGEALEKVRLKRENNELRQLVEEYQGGVRIVTQDAGMQGLLELARQVAPTDCNVLVTGESGTGKELLARFVHAHSQRAAGPFVAVNCGAFQEELLASELFGYEKGAFTGAERQKHGLVEMADGGTLFLDEIAEMSPAMQVKLLRVLQEREVLRVGGRQPLKVDVRFVAATNRDLQETVAAGRFRSDLYFRLNVVNLALPPLRQRPGDVPLLVHYFLKKHALSMGRKVHDVSPAAMAMLDDYTYPGNIRELANIIERGVALARGDLLEPAQLPEALKETRAVASAEAPGALPSLERNEADHIRRVLAHTRGNRSRAAQILGIDRVSLWRKVKRYGL